MNFLEFDENEGMIREKVLFVDGRVLYLMEYLKGEIRAKYRFHLDDKDGNILFRYDNAPHHNDVKTFPHHKHMTGDKILPSKEMKFTEVLKVLKEIERLILK